MDTKTIIKVAAAGVAVVLAIIFRGIVAGIVIGGMGAVVYFTWTRSTLNWKRVKK